MYKVEFWYLKNLCSSDTVSNKTYQYFRAKDWSDQEVNTKIDKDLNP